MSSTLKQTTDSSKKSKEQGYINSFDGTKIFYSSEGTGPPLIFCYGLVCSQLHWSYQINHFKKNHQVIWIDYRGHHNSAVPSDLSSLTIENLARDLTAVCAELRLENPVVLGHSMGVNVVLEFYRQNKDNVKALILSNGTPTPPLEKLLHTSLSRQGFDLLRMAYERSPELFTRLWKFQKKNLLLKAAIGFAGFNITLSKFSDISQYIDKVADIEPAVFFELIGNYDHYNALPWLHEVQVPTLLIGGIRDHITPLEQQKLMADKIPLSELRVISYGSHCPQMDVPDHFNMIVEDFLRRLKPGRGSASR